MANGNKPDLRPTSAVQTTSSDHHLRRPNYTVDMGHLVSSGLPEILVSSALKNENSPC